MKDWRILIIGDNNIVKDLLSELFIGEGCEVTTVLTGTDALKLLGKGKFDFVIADLSADHLNFFKIIPRIKAREHRLPIALINAEEKRKTADALIEAGADLVIDKPLEINRIFFLMSQAIAILCPRQ